MKKKHPFSFLLISALLCLMLAACGNSADTPPDSAADRPASDAEVQEPAPAQEPEADTPEETAEPAPQDSTAAESNILVVWFSRVGITPFDDSVDAVSSASTNLRDGELVGNVQYLAEFVAEWTGGDLFQIITEKEYPTDYRDTTDLAKEEQNADERPALTSHVDNMEQYDVVFLGYPNWWGTLPQAVMTFLEEYDFSGKTIVPFCSHGGSQLGRGPRDIADLCPGAEILNGLAVSASSVSDAQQDVQNWLDSLGLEF